MFVRDLLSCMYVLEFYLRRTYLRERLHVLAWRMQWHCLFSRKRLHPFPQTFATAPANVCNRHRKRLR